jgi:multiple sugar transport system permease protein
MSTHSTSVAPGASWPRSLWASIRRLLPKDLYPYILLSPTILVVLVIVVFPVGSAIDLSFRDVEMIRPNMDMGPFTLDNYIKLFKSEDFWSTLRFSLVYVVIVTGISYLIGLGTSTLLNQKFKGRRIARLLIVLPWAIPIVVATNIFWWLFNNTYGFVNYVLLSLGVIATPVDWFLEPVAAAIAVCVTTIWKGYPFFTIMLLAAMQSISKDLYDAAMVDGANIWQRFRFVTLPALRGVTGVAPRVSSLKPTVL